MGGTIAIVGASADRSKYGNKAVRAFRDGGWTVYPVNPRLDEVEGIRCHATVSEIEGPLDRVALYVPPSVGKTLLDDIAAKQPKEFFLNPGSEDDELIRLAREKGLNPIQACSIVNIGLSPAHYPDA